MPSLAMPKHKPKGNALMILHYLCERMRLEDGQFELPPVTVRVLQHEFCGSLKRICTELKITYNSGRKATKTLSKNNLIEMETIMVNKKTLGTLFKINVNKKKEHPKNTDFVLKIEYKRKKRNTLRKKRNTLAPKISKKKEHPNARIFPTGKIQVLPSCAQSPQSNKNNTKIDAFTHAFTQLGNLSKMINTPLSTDYTQQKNSTEFIAPKKKRNTLNTHG
tara:strand:+ start:1021 stop:1680 length:660 start_codon:yes stop_codon:yes gene_type:complete